MIDRSLTLRLNSKIDQANKRKVVSYPGKKTPKAKGSKPVFVRQIDAETSSTVAPEIKPLVTLPSSLPAQPAVPQAAYTVRTTGLDLAYQDPTSVSSAFKTLTNERFRSDELRSPRVIEQFRLRRLNANLFALACSNLLPSMSNGKLTGHPDKYVRLVYSTTDRSPDIFIRVMINGVIQELQDPKVPLQTFKSIFDNYPPSDYEAFVPHVFPPLFDICPTSLTPEFIEYLKSTEW